MGCVRSRTLQAAKAGAERKEEVLSAAGTLEREAAALSEEWERLIQEAKK